MKHRDPPYVVAFVILFLAVAVIYLMFFFDKCKTDADCGSAQICLGGSCEDECLTTADCDTGEVCLSGGCTLTCTNDNECLEQICYNGACVDCEDNLDCDVGESCVNNFCKA